MSRRPNFVLVCADQQRMDSLGCYGNRFVSSPGLDAMAANASVFDQAFTPWPVCTPARATMWTGVYPHLHGVIDNVYDIDNAFDSHSSIRETVFDHLQKHDYLTAHFGKWHLGEKRPPFFDIWEESFNSRCGHWIDGKLDGVYRPDRATDASIKFLRQRRNSSERPFVMVLSYYPPHDPYTAPKQFYEPYRGKGIPFAGYYAAVSALDHNLSRIRNTLLESGLADNTVLIYYSDHGDTFWYRREGEHKFVCYDDAIRIPLLIEGPGVQAGGRIKANVGLQDLTPTLLDYAEIPIPEWVQGRSLKPLLINENGVQDGREDIYIQNITHISAIQQRCLRTSNWKLIASDNDQHELYNLIEDPEEELDVFITPRPDKGFDRFKHYPDYAPKIAELSIRMREMAVSIGDTFGIQLAERVSAAIVHRSSGNGNGTNFRT